MSSTSLNPDSLGNTTAVAVAALDPAAVTKSIDLILNVAATMARFTGTDSDDKVVEVLKKLSHETWVVELLTTLIVMLSQGKQQEAMQMSQMLVAGMSAPA